MNKILEYHSKYLQFITKLKCDPILLVTVFTFFNDIRAMCVMYLFLLSTIHFPLIAYKNYKKLKKP